MANKGVILSPNAGIFNPGLMGSKKKKSKKMKRGQQGKQVKAGLGGML